MKKLTKANLIALTVVLNTVCGIKPELEFDKKAKKGTIADTLAEYLKEEPVTAKDVSKMEPEAVEHLKGLYAENEMEWTAIVKKGTKGTKTLFGHILNCQGGRIDKLLVDGFAGTVKEIAEQVGARVARAHDHLRVLANEKGVAYTEDKLKDGIYEIATVDGEPLE